MPHSKPPALRPQRFTLHLLPEGVDPATLDDPDLDLDALDLEAHRVTVLWADQLRAEAEGGRRGITAKSGNAILATLWVWAAMVRTGRTRDKWDVFRNRVIDVGDGDVDDVDEDAAATDVDDEAGPT